MAKGPLAGIKVLEFAGIGPAPFCCTMLADMGAEVVRIDRADRVKSPLPKDPPLDIDGRGRRSIGMNLKQAEGIEAVLKLIEKADVVVEGFRPGVMERLGLGPDVCAARNPRIVFGRMTGWGQEGPMAQAAGHDINYIALAGALEPIGRKGEPPTPPLNLVGDFGGGAMYLAFGIAAALVERASSGQGQVVDAAMVDGAASLMGMFYSMMHKGMLNPERGTNLLDSGAHFYDTYETKDGKYVSIGSIEPQFYALLLEKMGLAGEELPRQMDRNEWSGLKGRFKDIFKQKTRDEWCELMEGTDICFAPVLSMQEAPLHPHLVQRKTFVEKDGMVQPSPAPRFSRTVPELDRPPTKVGEHTEEVLGEFGFNPAEIAELKGNKAVA